MDDVKHLVTILSGIPSWDACIQVHVWDMCMGVQRTCMQNQHAHGAGQHTSGSTVAGCDRGRCVCVCAHHAYVWRHRARADSECV